uniref:Response regulatory domain-containing protein n=1 Tax=Ananas comosus var. bracteatus TaxID=296719 RepID=A0A6V7PR11_ANACO|nr:unnamed protein product [Ananas comosus var. bracteatus]
MDRGKAPAYSPISGEGCSAVLPERCRVLLVDGDAISREITEKILLECNNQVTTCSTGTEALAMLQDRKGEFDVVLSDVGLPDMNGYEFVRRVDSELQLPVIVMIAEGNTEFMTMISNDEVWGILANPSRRMRWKNREELSERGESSRAAAVAAMGAEKKPRLVWYPALQNLFIKAVNELGAEVFVYLTVPKKILERMNVPGLTRNHVASHLQKYRKQLKESQDQKRPDTNSTAASGLHRCNVLSQNLPSISTNQNSVHSQVTNTQISNSSAQITNVSNISCSSRQPIFSNQSFYHPGNSNNLRFMQLEQPHREHPSQNPVLRLEGSAVNNSQNPQQGVLPWHNISGQSEAQVALFAYLDYSMQLQQQQQRQQQQQQQQRQQQMFFGSQQNHPQLYMHPARQLTGEFTANNLSALPMTENNITPNNTWNHIAGGDRTNLNTDRSMVVGAPQLFHANNNQYAAELPAGCFSLSSNIEGFARRDSQTMADHFGETSNMTGLLSRELMNDDFYNHPSSLSHADYSVYMPTNQEENWSVSSDFDTKDNSSGIINPHLFRAHNFEDVADGVDSLMNEMQNDCANKV